MKIGKRTSVHLKGHWGEWWVGWELRRQHVCPLLTPDGIFHADVTFLRIGLIPVVRLVFVQSTAPEPIKEQPSESRVPVNCPN